MSKRGQTKLAHRVAIFLRSYERKARPGLDPNDRSYDRNVEEIVKRMDPVELDRLMHGDDSEPAA